MFSNNDGMYMPVAPAYSGGYGNNDGFFGGDFGGFILGLLFGGLGGWGGFGGFGGFGGGWGGFGNMMGFDYGIMPYLYNNQTQNDVNRGFADAALSSSIGDLSNAVTSGFGDVALGIAGVNQNICQTGNATVAAVNNAQSALAQQMYANQISDLERSFAAQTANTQGLNALQGQLAQCCCDNKSATNDLKYVIATENCADRAAISDGIRDLLAATQAQTQTILTQMCNDKIEQKNDTINQLRSELLYARGQASQDVQTAVIQAGQRSLANEVEQYVAPRAIPSYTVQNPNCCTNYSACGCGNF